MSSKSSKSVRKTPAGAKAATTPISSPGKQTNQLPKGSVKMEPVKKAVVNRNVYEAVGGDEQPTSKSSKGIVNRNVYEAVGGDEQKSQSGKGPINRNIYEAVGGDEQPTQTAKGGMINRNIYEAVGGEEGESKPTEVGAAKGGDDDKDDENDKIFLHNQFKRRVLRAQQLQEAKRKKRMQTIGIVIGAVVLIVAVFGIGVYLITRPADKKTKSEIPKPKGTVTEATYGYAICTMEWKFEDILNILKFGVDADCHTVMLPEPRINQSCGYVECRNNLGRIFDKSISPFLHTAFHPEDVNISRIFKPHPGLGSSAQRNVTNPLFCFDRYSREKMVCVNGECDYKYVGKIEAYNLDELIGKWVDACDTDFFCHDKFDVRADLDKARLMRSNTFKRSVCNENVTCRDGMAAIVYMQKMACEVNPDRAGDFCKFEMATPDDKEDGPFRLFKCKDCPDYKGKSSMDAANQVKVLLPVACTNYNFDYESSESCWAKCKDPGTGEENRVMLPDGAFCPDFLPHFGYCVGGGCFWWNPNYTAKAIDPIPVCEKAKSIRHHAYECNYTFRKDEKRQSCFGKK